MDTANNQPHLFVRWNGPTSVRRRDRVLESNIRRHIMVDIGRARRKPPRNPQFDFIVPLPPTGTTTKEQCHDSNVSAKTNQHHWPQAHLVRPFWDQQPLTVLDQQWEMDKFSAYGIILMMTLRKNPEGANTSASTFWFPFAFKESTFLRQFRPIFSSPDVLGALYWEPPAKFKSLALERSMGTIECMGSRLAKPDSYEATCNSMIRAVLAIICYNFINLDFDQALLHLKGLELMIATRGGITCLKGDDELRLMVFWVDITASLLYNLKPRFMLPSDLILRGQPTTASKLLPIPLFSIMEAEATRDAHFMHVTSCMTDLNAVAALIQSDINARGDALWEDVEQVSLRINPLTHRLFDQPEELAVSAHFTVISKALRLGAIVWIIWMKRRCRSYPSTATAYVSQLLSLLSSQKEWNKTPTSSDVLVLRLWLLVLCGISSSGPAERANAVDTIAHEMQQQGLDTWHQVMMRFRQMPWVSVFEAPCVELEGHIQTLSLLVYPQRHD